MKAFVDGLNDPVRIIVKASRPTELRDAIQTAVEEERSTMVHYQGTASSSHSRQNNRDDNEIPYCRYCHKNGHVLENCRKRSYNNSRRQNFYTNQSDGNGSHDLHNSNTRGTNQYRSTNNDYGRQRQNELEVPTQNISNHKQKYTTGNGSGPSVSGSGIRVREIKTVPTSQTTTDQYTQ